MATRRQHKCYAVKINAGNDNNGNPRRGWLCYNAHGEYYGFVDEGYVGHRALTEVFPNVVELCTIPTTPGTYRDAKKDRVD
jgi:hypothetical protein